MGLPRLRGYPGDRIVSSQPSLISRAPKELISAREREIPSRSQLLLAGSGALAALAAVLLVPTARLPHDGTFEGVLYLMWSANWAHTWIPNFIRAVITWVALIVPLVLLSWAIVWPRTRSAGAVAALGWAYRFAPFWPLLLLLSGSLGRTVANLVYTFASTIPADATPSLAHLEGALLEQIQRQFEHPWLSTLFSHVYSWVWIAALYGFGPWLVLRGKESAASQMIVGTALTALLAVPFFVLVPVFDAWATNPLYGYQGAGQTGVRYLYPGADLQVLTHIATRDRWATGSCLPSLHTAYPFLFALIAARHRLRAAAWVTGGVAALTALAVIYLGRHWVSDVLVSIPFVLGVHWLVRLIDPHLGLRLSGDAAGGA